MDFFLIWIEESALTAYLRETNSVFVFPTMLVLHAVGMALLVGTHLVVSLRVLGVASRVPLSAMAPFISIAWAGFGVNIFSGVLLLIAYPTKALTNPLFYIKMTCVVLALMAFSAISKSLFSESEFGAVEATHRNKSYALAVLILWASTIAAGRFLAYTYTRLTVFN